MLRKSSSLRSMALSSTDGDIGRVKDLLFDDECWAIRYLVADTGTWLTGRRVLLSPHAVAEISEEENRVRTKVSRSQVESSPSIDEAMPVSRQYETELYRYYGWPFYWHGPDIIAGTPRPATSYSQVTTPVIAESGADLSAQRTGDPHLRSAQEVAGYNIQAQDGQIGHVEDFLIDDADWQVRYLVIDTRNWWPGKKVLVRPTWATTIDWNNSTVAVAIDRHMLKTAPEYDPSEPVTRELEERFHAHYSERPYWQQREAA